MISCEIVMEIVKEHNLNITEKHDDYVVCSYKNVEVCRMAWRTKSLFSFIHDYVKVSVDIFVEDIMESDISIYWGGTSFFDISNDNDRTIFCERLKKLCENIDKAKIIAKQMTSASKIAIIEGE